MEGFFRDFLLRSKYIAQGLDYIVRLNPGTDQAEMIRQELRAAGKNPDDDRLVGVERTRFSRIMDEFEKDIPFQILTSERPKKLTQKGQELRELLIALKKLLRGATSIDESIVNICGLESLLSAFVEPRCVAFLASLQQDYKTCMDLCRKNPETFTREQLDQKKIMAGLRLRVSESRSDENAMKSVKTGYSDLAVVTEAYFSSLGKIDKKDLHYQNLGVEEYCWALPCDQGKAVKFLENAKSGQLPLVKLAGKGPINQKLPKLFPRADWRIETSNFEGVRRILHRNRTMGGILTTGAAAGLDGFALLPLKLFDSKNGCILLCKKEAYRTVAKINTTMSFFHRSLIKSK